jgi:transcriptional regulator with XRE-family HTH domain
MSRQRTFKPPTLYKPAFVRTIRELRAKGFTASEISLRLGVSRNAIITICVLGEERQAPQRPATTKAKPKAEELKDLLKQLELSQVGAARFLGVDERTVRRWVLGEPIMPVAMRFLRFLAGAKISPIEVMETLAR